MFDKELNHAIRPLIERGALILVSRGISPNTVTATGLVLGLAAAGFVASGFVVAGLAFVLLSRLADGLDGAVARVSARQTHLGGFLDIVFDFIFYGSIPIAFAILDPAANAVAAGILVLTFYANGGSVLAFAVMAERTGIAEDRRGGKSLVFSVGLMEGGETLLFFVLFCLLPGYFAALAFVFACLTAWTCAARIALAIETFR